MYYINFYFKDITYDDNFYCAEFSCPDLDVFCNFKYNRVTEQCDIWNNNKPIDKIKPIPIWWLDKTLDENGKLSKCESKISY